MESDQSDKRKQDFFQVVAASVLLNRSTTWTLIKCIEKKLAENYIRMLYAVLNLKQHPTKQQLYGQLPLISQTIQVRRAKPAGHYNRHSLIDRLMDKFFYFVSTKTTSRILGNLFFILKFPRIL